MVSAGTDVLYLHDLPCISMGAVWLYDKARRQKLLWKKWIQYLLTGALLAVGYEIRATVILTVCSIVMYTVLQIGGVKEEISYFGTVSTDSDGSTAAERGKHFDGQFSSQSSQLCALWQDLCWYLPHMARSAITMQDLIHQRRAIQQSTGS